MADLNNLKATIDANIRSNGEGAITGEILNDVLNTMVDGIGGELDTKVKVFEAGGVSYAEAAGLSTDQFSYALPDTANGNEDDVIITKTTLKTINGESLYGKGDLTIQGGGESYDDSEINNKLTELSAEVGEVSEAVGKKADEQGYYPNLSVGMADNLLGHAPAVEREIVFDATASKDNDVTEDVARIEAIKGNSVVWNQRINRTYKTTTHNGVTFTVNSDGSVTANGTSDATASLSYLATLRSAVFTSHKYFVYGGASGGSVKTYYFGDGNNLNCYDSAPIITNALKDATTVTFAFRVAAGVSVENITFPAPIVIDLTQMFGAGNEPTTIEEFYSRIPSGVDINAYNEGEVIHNYATGLKSVGFNAWDEQCENGALKGDGSLEALGTRLTTSFIEVLPNATYHQSGPSSSYNGRYLIYDADKNVIFAELNNGVTLASKEFTTPQNAKYVRITFGTSYGTTYKNDICIHLAHTGYRNGEYAPYWEESIGLPNTLVFADGMKSAGSARDEVYYDRYAKKWRVIKRIGVVDMGTFTWVKGSSEGLFYVLGNPFGNIALPSNNAIKCNILTSGYDTISRASLDSTTIKSISVNSSGSPYLRDTSYTDAASLKASLQGVMLYYELAEPIESDLDDYLPATMSAEERAKVHQFIYRVSDFGTEQMLTDEGVKSSALVADIVYGVDAFRTLVNLRKRVAALEK